MKCFKQLSEGNEGEEEDLMDHWIKFQRAIVEGQRLHGFCMGKWD